MRIATRKQGALVLLVSLVVAVIAVPRTDSDPSEDPGQSLAETSAATTTASLPDLATTTNPTAATMPSVLTYSIVEEDDVSYADVTRYSLRVLLERGATVEDMENVTADIVETYRDRQPYDALSISYYHLEVLSQDVFTLGRAEDVPFGEWARAEEAESDFSNFEIATTYFEKDWSLLPTDEELAAYFAYIRVFDEMDDGVNLPDDEDVIPATAAELGVSEEEVQAGLDALFF